MCVKKLLSILGIGVMAIALPLGVSAEEITFELNANCTPDTNCPDDEGYCYTTCTTYVADLSVPIEELEFSINFESDSGVDIVEMQAEDGWELVSSENSTDISLIADETISGNRFNVLQYRIRHLSDVNCDHELVYLNSKVTVTTETEEQPENPSTGATLPIAILACGVGAVAVIYVVSKKNKKLYKI